MITKLTNYQEQQIKEYYNQYLSKGLSTLPSNKLIAEKAIKQMYKFMNEKEPKIYWVSSPTELIALVKDRNSLWNSLWNSLDNSLRNSLDNSLRNSLRNSLWNSLDNSLWNSLDNSLRNSLDNSLDNSLWNSLWNSLDNSLRNSLWNSFWNSLRNSLCYAQTNANWIGFYKYCNEVLGVKYDEKEIEKLNLWVDMMECSCFFVFKGNCILMEHPQEIHLDNEGKNHNLNSYAIKWYDNTGIYCVHGNIIVEKEFLDKNKLMKEEKITKLEYFRSKYEHIAIK